MYACSPLVGCSIGYINRSSRWCCHVFSTIYQIQSSDCVEINIHLIRLRNEFEVLSFYLSVWLPFADDWLAFQPFEQNRRCAIIRCRCVSPICTVIENVPPSWPLLLICSQFVHWFERFTNKGMWQNSNEIDVLCVPSSFELFGIHVRVFGEKVGEARLRWFGERMNISGERMQSLELPGREAEVEVDGCRQRGHEGRWCERRRCTKQG